MNYAVLENDVIVNVLVFDDLESALTAGCFEMAQEQKIGEPYIAPEEYERLKIKNKQINLISSIQRELDI